MSYPPLPVPIVVAEATPEGAWHPCRVVRTFDPALGQCYTVEYVVKDSLGATSWRAIDGAGAQIEALDRRIEALKIMLSHFPGAEDWDFLAQIEAELENATRRTT